MHKYSVNKSPRAIAVAGLGLIGLTSIAGAQELFGSFSDYSQASGYELQKGALGESDHLDCLKYGIRTGLTFDDNIFLSAVNEESDVISITDLVLTLENGADAQNTWVATYVPSFRFYADNSNLDGVNHNLNGGFTKVLPKTELDLSVDFASTSGSSRYAAGQVDKTTYGVEFAASHLLTGKTRADFDFNFRSDDYDGNASLSDRDFYDARLAWIYQWTGKVNVGPYVGYEFTDVSGQNNHEAVSLGATFEYDALAKTSFNGFIGGENRSFEGGAGDKSSVAYRLGARHQYSAKTSFEAAAYRSVRPSYGRDNGSYTSTGLLVGAKYAATDRVKLHSRFNFESDNYFGALSAGRDNDYFSFTVGGDYALPCGLKLGAGLTLREKDGDTGAADFSNTLFQVDATYYF